MKQNKCKIIILVLIGSLLISLGFNIYLGFKNTDSDNNSESGLESTTSDDTKQKQLICTTKSETETYNSITTISFNILDTGAILNYKTIMENTYANERIYSSEKEVQSDDYTSTYDDSKMQITKTFKDKQFINENNEVINVWYINHKQQLESEGYECNIIEE